jgi:CBS domain-containing protein
MWEEGRGVVPVVAADGRLAGILTDRDICMAAWIQGKTLHEIPVASAMARAIVARSTSPCVGSWSRRSFVRAPSSSVTGPY